MHVQCRYHSIQCSTFFDRNVSKQPSDHTSCANMKMIRYNCNLPTVCGWQYWSLAYKKAQVKRLLSCNRALLTCCRYFRFPRSSASTVSLSPTTSSTSSNSLLVLNHTLIPYTAKFWYEEILVKSLFQTNWQVINYNREEFVHNCD